MQELNIKTLSAMLMSYDYDKEGRSLQVRARDTNAQDAQADIERGEYRQQFPRARQALAMDEIAGDYSEYHIRPQRYREIYIYSKLMLIDDSFITLGSANMNQRSMSADSEINLASDCPLTTRELRERVFRLHSGERVSGGTGQRAAIQAFDDWTSLMQENKDAKDSRKPLTGFLLPFEELRESEQRYG